ncbi:Octopine transport system permease protein OccM [Marinomonas spartinae]|uniref:Octopine transport system permease protein OccM n=1 Tax=Marinomonas spartinae TaxID=1792290 RepID=A0A1A8T2Z4_9GAMM|nr:ABC transporter permease subunit [Marinomonas spartinae]SBS26156.1 Octopine transport system permease protein OccM [Marinomonas spartinae]SBS39997.1 Octopine transport system permease protein OccM [Marinomonas spartinae]
MNWVFEYSDLLIKGFLTTLELISFSLVIGFVCAIGVALCRVSETRWLAWPANAFTSVIRGTPLLVQIYIVYFGLGSIFAHMPIIRSSFIWPYLRDGFWYMVFALVLSFAAYVGEVVRGGLVGVPKGELEAAKAIGMSPYKVMLRIRLPRALYQVLPTLAGESVMLLKSTALASTIAVVDLLGAANEVRSMTFEVYQPLILVAIIYIVLTLIIEQFFGRLERRIPVRR